jgi:hypothetical protein
MRESGLDASGLGQGHVAGSCYMVMHLMLTKEREFYDQLSDYHVVKTESCRTECIIKVIDLKEGFSWPVPSRRLSSHRLLCRPTFLRQSG